MTTKSIKIEYTEYESVEQLSTDDKELLTLAMNASANAYSPYSKFKVGCAVRLANGTIVTGNNQENIAYPSGLCAERVALFSAVAQHPNIGITSIAIIAQNQDDKWCGASPCGACRQVIGEYESKSKNKIKIVLYQNDGSIMVFDGINSLLPFRFSM